MWWPSSHAFTITTTKPTDAEVESTSAFRTVSAAGRELTAAAGEECRAPGIHALHPHKARYVRSVGRCAWWCLLVVCFVHPDPGNEAGGGGEAGDRVGGGADAVGVGE